MKVTLPNGMTLEHSNMDEIVRSAKTLGFTLDATGWYFSESHQTWVEIKLMDTNHLRNAMLKTYRAWASTLSTLSHTELIRAFRSGCDNPQFAQLLTEFIRRTR
jgi:hypothetical protein